MATTARLSIVLLDVAQSQKEVSCNNAFSTIDLLVFRNTGDSIARAAVTTGLPVPLLTITSPSDTGLTAATELLDVSLNFTATKTWATGAITNQRHVLIQGGTLAAAGASVITNAATVHILGPPVAGANVTLTNAAALWVQGPVCFGSNVQGTSKAGFSFAQGQTNAQPTAIYVAPVASATLTAATEVNLINLALNRVVTWATGALTTQREFLIQAPTYAFVAASTITNAATLAITGAPAAGTNATITNPYSLWCQGGTARFDGSPVFEVPADTTVPTTIIGRIPVRIGGVTRFLAYYS
jgi:hypothetical protein